MFSIILLTVLISSARAPSPTNHIPDTLIACYENGTLYDNAVRLQPSIATLIAIIGKVERSAGRNMDLRTFSATILRRFRTDGIQRVPEVPIAPGITPFSTNGRQYPKFQIVMEQLIPPGTVFPEDSLTEYEKCALHFMLSSSVQPWQRGDEHEVCPVTIGGRSSGISTKPKSNQPRSNTPKTQPRSWSEWPTPPDEDEDTPSSAGQISRCPIEEGVLWTHWGAVSGAALIGGIAAALHPQRVPITQLLRRSKGRTDDMPPVDNVWGATLAGDLAEVAVYQGPRAPDSTFMRLGPGGQWNDTAYARMLYFDPWTGPTGTWEEESWDMTEAEHRGGTDGLILGTKLPRWMQMQGSLRLSQLLDMYYSERGVAMDAAVRACRRAALFNQVVTFPTLEQQTESFAIVLQGQAGSVPISPIALSKFVKSTIDAYRRFSETVMWKDMELNPCTESITVTPHIELLTVLDGTWTTWEGQRIISTLERYSDVSAYGSAIAVMDGWTGETISNFTRLSSYTVRRLDEPKSWPNGLNMELTVRGARKLFQRRRALEAKRGENIAANSRGTVVLVLANTATNDPSILKRANEEMRICMEMMPDMTWLFVTARRREDYEAFVTDPTRDIITADEGEMESFMPALINRLKEVPGRIVPAMCPSLVQKSLHGLPVIEWTPVEPKGPQYEEYVTPGEKRVYRVPPASLLGTTRVKFTIRSSNYGDLIVCKTRVQPGTEPQPPPFPNISLDDEERCENLLANSEVKFILDQPCSNMDPKSCRPVYIWLIVQRTDFKCTEEECRYPDQVRFSLWHEGLNPLPGCETNISSRTILQKSLFILLIIFTLWR